MTLTNPAAGDETVLLASDHAEAILPPSIIVHEGETSASFTINTTSQLTKVIANISARLNGSIKSKGLTINPATLASISFSPPSVFGGASPVGTLTLTGPAPVGGLTVTLRSNNSAVASVPETVTVPEGVSYATFYATTSVVYVNTTCSVTAAANGVAKATTLTVKSHLIGAMSTAPNTVRGGSDSTGTVKLTAPAGPGGVIVTLSSDHAEVVVPDTVTVPEGQNVTTFPINTTPVAAQFRAYIKGQIGASYKTTVITVKP
ncbi:MAG: hypothetical protein HY248_04755 [Fimbriimonas ginsengisoli]|nr:hypothetical protein [Fimbriimonas ginsengisoli]